MGFLDDDHGRQRHQPGLESSAHRDKYDPGPAVCSGLIRPNHCEIHQTQSFQPAEFQRRSIANKCDASGRIHRDEHTNSDQSV